MLGNSEICDRGERGSLKAWERTLASVRCEKVVSSRSVRIWENDGESMRSAVSSRSRRRRGELLGDFKQAGEEGGEGTLVVGIGWEGLEGVDMPDSWRTKSSWSSGGRRYGSHFLAL